MSSGENAIGVQVNKATKWSFITEILAKIIVPITNAILAHLLLPEDFGLIATINMVISFTDVLTESGFGQYLIQHDFKSEKEYGRAIDVAFWCNFVVSMGIWLFIVILRNPIAELVGSKGYGMPLCIACISIPITSFYSIPLAVLQKKLDYRSIFFNRIAGSITPLVVSGGLALAGLGYWSLIIGTLCGNIVKATVLIIKSGWYPRKYFSIEQLKKMLRYSVWILLESVAMWACTWIDIFIISRYFGAHYVGLYKTSQTTVTGILSVVTASVNSVLFVTLSKLKNERSKFEEVFYEFQRNLAILVIPMGIGIYIFSDLITHILLGKEWYEAAEFLGIWAVCMSLVATMGTFCREALRAKGFPRDSMIIQLLHLLFIIPVIIFGAGNGYQILIYLRSFAYLQVIFLLHLFAKFRLGLSPIKILRNTVWPMVCAVVMGVFGWIIKDIYGTSFVREFVCVFLCVLLYFLVLCIKKDYRNRVMSIMRTVLQRRRKEHE